MKKIFFLVLAVLLIGAGLSFERQYGNDLKIFVVSSSCDKPIHFRVDIVDKRFGLSRAEFEKDIEQAGSVWEKATGRDLFVDDESGSLSVNLIFDERQSLTNKINQLQGNLDTQNNSLAAQIADFEKRKADFSARVDALNSEINKWNSQGGAPKDVYDRLSRERDELQKEADSLNQTAKDLNQSAAQFNVGVGKLNQTIGQFNQELEAKPEEGVYDGRTNRIEIYFNVNREELLHTLSHEMGHALGIGHLSDPKSIMYPSTTKITTLSAEDISAIQKVCNQRILFNRFPLKS